MNQKKDTSKQEYRQVITISTKSLAIINGYINATSEDEYQSEDETITYTAKFPDGKEMDVKCCGCQDGPSWTEAVLFTPSGYELVCTEPSYGFDGPWIIEYNGITYIADVIPTDNG